MSARSPADQFPAIRFAAISSTARYIDDGKPDSRALIYLRRLDIQTGREEKLVTTNGE
jgi:hypothetical protein